MSVDDVIEAVRAAAGADFAFVLTMRGRLVTRDAPRDMPEIGRGRLVAAAREIGDAEVVTEVEMPREQLVPFGGAAPVDVFVGVAGDKALVCVVMASWADKKLVIPAIQEGLSTLEPMIANAATKRAGGKRRVPAGVPAPPGAITKTKTERPPKKRGALAGLLHLSGTDPVASAALKRAPLITAPEIQLGEAPLGRETIDAIDRERHVQGPEASLGFTPGIGSAPDVRVELVSMGRESEVDLRIEEAKRMQSLAAVPDKLIAAAASRLTQPWAEDAIATKRAADAASTGRKVAAPKVTVRLEDADEDIVEALLIDQIADEELDAEGPPSGEVPSPEVRPPQTSLEVWRAGLTEITKEPGPQKKR